MSIFFPKAARGRCFLIFQGLILASLLFQEKLPALANRDPYLFSDPAPPILYQLGMSFTLANKLAFIDCCIAGALLFFKKRTRLAWLMLSGAFLLFVLDYVCQFASLTLGKQVRAHHAEQLTEIMYYGWSSMSMYAFVLAIDCYLVSLPSRIAFNERHKSKISILILNLVFAPLPFLWAPLLVWSLGDYQKKLE